MPGRTGAQFTIDQTLHGYRQGHRWLAGSVRLDGQADATLLALTDLLTSDLSNVQPSYLSGYPLREINRYVLSRTWLAPESSRPGSVWSHSLILDYAALTLIDDLSRLLPLLRRPDGPSDLSYAKPIPNSAIDRSGILGTDTKPGAIIPDRASSVLHGLYGPSALRTLSIQANDQDDDEALAVSIWRQMWPGLRRDFAFFTRVRGEVDEIKATATLHFRTDEIPNSIPTARSAPQRAYEILERDLSEAGPTELRRFLGRYAYDAPEPRRIVPDLVLMHEQSSQPAAMALILKGRLMEGASLPRLKRDILLQAIHSDDVSVVVDVLSAFRSEPIAASVDEIDKLVSGSLHRDRNAVGRVLAAATPSVEGELGDAVTRAMARQASAIDIAQAKVDLETRFKLLTLRPDLAAERAFWPDSATERQPLLALALELSDGPDAIVGAIGGRLLALEANEILIRYGTAAEMPLFESIRTQLPDAEAWTIIQALIRRPGFLGRESLRNRTIGLHVLDALLAMVPEVGLGPENWLALFHREAEGRIPVNAPNLAAGMLQAALTAPMPIAARLFEASFDAIYEGLDRWALPSRIREMLEQSLGRRSKEWRLVDKLVAAVVDRYGGVDRPLSGLFLVTARSDALRDIVDRIERKGRKGALDGLVEHSERQNQPRLHAGIEYARSVIKRRAVSRWAW